MLENIKSSFFTKILFSYLKEWIKLKMIQYNKNLQNLLGINLFNYKIFSKRIIIYEENGKAKEYSCVCSKDTLIFEGEYLNGERNGKGKEYHVNGKLKYEGEYLNGERNGKGKEYSNRGRFIFESEYLNGERKEKQ